MWWNRLEERTKNRERSIKENKGCSLRRLPIKRTVEPAIMFKDLTVPPSKEPRVKEMIAINRRLVNNKDDLSALPLPLIKLPNPYNGVMLPFF